MEDKNIISKIAHLSASIRIDQRKTYVYLSKLLAPDYATSINILRSKKPFLITSTGRTGTKLLAKLLNNISGNYVVHEPVPKEQYYHVKALMFPDIAKDYIKMFRIKEMSYRIYRNNCTRYGEVNGALRRHIVALKEIAPFFKIIHIIRDGRAVVASVLNRKSMTKDDKIYYKMSPPETDIKPSVWCNMTRFQKLCWLWAYENKFMREHSDFSVKFEEIISSYGYFEEHLLKPLNLKVSYEKWKDFIGKKVNATQNEKKYQYKDWSDNEKSFFWNTCHEEMELFGYKD